MDLLAANAYEDLAKGLRVAFYVGESDSVGGTKTYIVAYANDHAFVQAWIGVEDRLPRRLRAIYRKDPAAVAAPDGHHRLEARCPGRGERVRGSRTPRKRRCRFPSTARSRSRPPSSDAGDSHEINDDCSRRRSRDRRRPQFAAAYTHANRAGGSTSHAYGEGTEHTNAYGGSSEHAWGGGSEHTNMYGGSTEGRYGDGAEHTNVYGGTTAARTARARTTRHRMARPLTRHRPRLCVPPAGHGQLLRSRLLQLRRLQHRGSRGCRRGGRCRGGVCHRSIGAAGRDDDRLRRGRCGRQRADGGGDVGDLHRGQRLPDAAVGLRQPDGHGTVYYLCGNTWFEPAYGANGVYYTVVTAP